MFWDFKYNSFFSLVSMKMSSYLWVQVQVWCRGGLSHVLRYTRMCHFQGHQNRYGIPSAKCQPWYHGRPWLTMVSHGQPWCIDHGQPWTQWSPLSTMLKHGWPWSAVLNHGALAMVNHGHHGHHCQPCLSMVDHGQQCSTMEHWPWSTMVTMDTIVSHA